MLMSHSFLILHPETSGEDDDHWEYLKPADKHEEGANIFTGR